jgi:hypothetical protein
LSGSEDLTGKDVAVPAEHPAGHCGSPEDLVRVLQLSSGGRLVHPVGPGGREQVTAFHQEAGRLVADARLAPAYLVSLVGTHGLRSQQGRDQR